MGKKIDDNDIEIFKSAVNSQYSSVLYKQLKRDKRLDRFICALQLCAVRCMSLTETCKQLTMLFPSYMRGKGLNVKTLTDMISFYPDLEDAWSFSADLVKMQAFNKATDIMMGTDDIGVVDKFNNMYDDGNLLYIRESNEKFSDSQSADNKVVLYNSRVNSDCIEDK